MREPWPPAFIRLAEECQCAAVAAVEYFEDSTLRQIARKFRDVDCHMVVGRDACVDMDIEGVAARIASGNWRV